MKSLIPRKKFNNIFQPVITVAFIVALLASGSLQAQTNLEEVFSFAATPQNPFTLVASQDGNVYGTSIYGGTNGLARIFKVTPEGAVSTVATFDSPSEVYPKNLIEGADGRFYGFTQYDRYGRDGTVFRVDNGAISTVTNLTIYNEGQISLIAGTDGYVYGVSGSDIFKIDSEGNTSTVHSFSYPTNVSPCFLQQDGAGNFYDFSSYDGGYTDGTLFRTAPDGTLTSLFTFEYFVTGSEPRKGLLGEGGNFYVQAWGPDYWSGYTVSKITANGEYLVLWEKAPAISDWIQSRDGNIYAVTSATFENPGGLFRLTTNGEYSLLYSFSNAWANADGYYNDIERRIVEAKNGHLFCSLMIAGIPDAGEGAVLELTTAGDLVNTISLGKDSLFYGVSSGIRPLSTLQLADNGSLYGTTSAGGHFGTGTLFRISPTGVLSNIISLTYGQQMPITAPVRAKDGNFYGAGVGLVSMTPAGTLTASEFEAWSIQSETTFTKGADGNFYGAKGPGFFETDEDPFLNIFQTQPGGQISNIYSFEQRGIYVSTLVEDSKRNLYGIYSKYLLDSPETSNYGVFFRLSRNRVYNELTMIDQPTAPLVRGNDGCFYGLQGGVYHWSPSPWPGYPTLDWFPDRAIKIDTNGVVTGLATFTSETGTGPLGPLCLASDGNFYGTTQSGGVEGYGTIFRITPVGQVDQIVSFSREFGNLSQSGLTQGADGKLYGVSVSGGRARQGSVYRLDLGMTPPTNAFSKTPTGTYNGTLTGMLGKKRIVGYFTFKLAANRQFNGRILLNGMICPFKGTFDETYQTTVFPRKRGSPLQFSIFLTKGIKYPEVHGTATLNSWIGTVIGRRTVSLP